MCMFPAGGTVTGPGGGWGAIFTKPSDTAAATTAGPAGSPKGFPLPVPGRAKLFVTLVVA